MAPAVILFDTLLPPVTVAAKIEAAPDHREGDRSASKSARTSQRSVAATTAATGDLPRPVITPSPPAHAPKMVAP